MASSATLVSELLERNKEYVKTHKPMPYFSEIPKGISGPRTLIFCCLDGRVRPEEFLGLKPRGEALLIRNAGGHVPRNFNDILLLDQFVGIEEILVIEHTNCGATQITDEKVQEGISKYSPDGHDHEITELKFGTFEDPEARARDFVNFIKTHPFIRPELAQKTVGIVYDIKTGEVTKVSE
ncbi:carbonic anhydrase [Xylariales sp. PMI_506]|nr:carbonic anhydrase [Xylariales sp. PMI_506]